MREKAAPDAIDATDREKHAGVDLRCPVMLHDCALAGDDVVVFDFPLTVRPARMLSDKFPVRGAASNVPKSHRTPPLK